MQFSKSVRVAAAGLVISIGASAQTITPIAETGMVITGIGTVNFVTAVAVDDSGHVLVCVQTDNPNPDLAWAVLDESGTPVLYAGQSVAQPAGAVIRDFYGSTLGIGPTGKPSATITLLNTPGGTTDNHGIYCDLPLQLQAQQSVVSTAPELNAGSTFQLFLYPKLNTSDQVCFHSVVDDPSISGQFDTPALFLIDALSGSQHVVAKRGDILPGQTYAISDFGWNRNQLSIDSSGHLMYVVTTYNVSSLNSNIYLDHTKIAQGGDISPFGSSYLSFSSVALDDQDNYLFRCHLNDPFGEYGIVSNAAAIVQVGDSFPSIEPFQINYLGTPLFLGNDGRVIWTGTWDSAAGPQGTGIFADYALLVSVGGTVIHGVPVQELTLVDGSLTLSQSGQYLVFLARLADNTVGAYRINLWQ